jgi:Ca2+-binding RTX toxin-like protein
MLRLATLATLLATAALGAAPTQAATVSATYQYVPGHRGSGGEEATVTITAAPGERNAMTLTLAPGQQTLDVTDTGAPLTAGAGCAPTAAGVTCAAPTSSAWHGTVDLGDDDDAVTLAGNAYLDLRGGDGDDALRLQGGVYGTLRGGPGNDRLHGGTRGTFIEGGPGDDVMDADGGGVTVSYADHTAPVTASIAAGTGGAADEHDTLGAYVNELVGGRGDDALTGSDARDVLSGGPGNDRLEGLGGDDLLDQDHEADAILGGDGDDRLVVGPGGRADGGPAADVITISRGATALGGSGPDRVTVLSGRAAVDVADDARDLVVCHGDARLRSRRLDALDLTLGCGRPSGHPRPGAIVITGLAGGVGGVDPTLICPDTARAGCAPVALSATVDGRRVGRKVLHLEAGTERLAQLFPRIGVPLRRWHEGGTVRVTATMRDTAGRLRRSTRTACLAPHGALPPHVLRDGPCRGAAAPG